jgi:hypothetical protein
VESTESCTVGLFYQDERQSGRIEGHLAEAVNKCGTVRSNHWGGALRSSKAVEFCMRPLRSGLG